MITIEVRCQVEDLLHREAHLLDSHDYHGWLELLTEDVVYCMPLTEYVVGDVPPAGHAIMNETKDMLRFRVAKDESGYSHAETPRSLTCHIVSNILIEEIPDTADLHVYSTFLVRQARRLRGESWWAGRRTDTLRSVESGWKICRREVELHSAILPRGISIFL